MAQWFQTAFKKFGEQSTTVWIALAVLVVLGLGILTITKNKQKWTAKMLAYASLSVALSFVLSCIRLWKMPQGGSITPASMLPLMLFAYVYGVGPGVLAGVVYGLLQCIQDAWILNIWQFLLDYPIAFGVIGLAGLFNKKPLKWGLPAGIFVACLGRFISSLLSGVVFFSEYAAQVNMNPWIYSIGYNGTYMLPEAIISIVLALIIGPRIIKEMKRA